MASIKNLGKDGKYRIFISNGYDGRTGKRNIVSKVITAKSEKDAEKQAKNLEYEVTHGVVEHSNNTTFQELVDRWREIHGIKLAEKTYERYDGILETIMLPCFGRKKVKDIKAYSIEIYMKELDKDGIRVDGKSGGYSQKTKKHHYQLLSSIFEKAVKWDIVSVNPCRKVDAPELEKSEAKCYQPEQVEKLLEHLKDAEMKYKVFVHLALFSGCRKGELLGLEWKDVNFENNSVSINRVSQYTKKKGIFTRPKPKTAASKRTIKLPSGTVELLKEYMVWQDAERAAKGDSWQDFDRLFTQEDGKPMHPDTPYQWFVEFLEKQSLPKITVHQLRHTHISILIYQGTDIVAVSKRAGHSNVTTTLNTYSHIIEKADAEGANKLEDMFYKKQAV